MRAATLARIDRYLRPWASNLPSRWVVAAYSRGRGYFLQQLSRDLPERAYCPPTEQARVLWGIRFRSPILNAAGMFKNGESYELTARQGAGAYLGGTSTWNARAGNQKGGIARPFAPYPRSAAASNWMGLPNDGDPAISQRVQHLGRSCDTPVGWSLAASPDLVGEEQLRRLAQGLELYTRAGVDFLEVNESCPNLEHGQTCDQQLRQRLEYLREHYLIHRPRGVPVIVKFSNDTALADVPFIMDTLFALGYDGVNFGNTSTAYQQIRPAIARAEQPLFDYFTCTFGGGVSGRPLKDASLQLAARAAEYLRAGPPAQEFHVVRTGGIESARDLRESERAGISLNQWFTGYFESFARFGHQLYRSLLESK